MDEGEDREEKGGVSDAQLMQEITARDNEVAGLLRRKDKVRALIVSLQNPPISSKSIAVKVMNYVVITLHTSSAMFHVSYLTWTHALCNSLSGRKFCGC